MTFEVHAQEARIETTFLKTRPMLNVTITQHSDGTWAVYTGKGRMSLCTRGHPDPATAADVAIARMKAEDMRELSDFDLEAMAQDGDADASFELDRRWLNTEAGERERDIKRRMTS